MDTVFFCEADECRLEFIRGRYSYYYRCPECQNRISVREAQRIRNDLETKEYENELEDKLKGKAGNVNYKIKKIDENVIAVAVTNKRVIKK